VWHEPPTVYLKPFGGTWFGYTLGIVGALLILWLMLLGIRKRRYRSSMGTMQGWTSAHVYFGVSLAVIVTLHSGFEFGWNVHTLAYTLMMLVIVSGILGVYAYLRYPALMTKNVGDDTVESIMLKIADLDRKCRTMALDLPDEANKIVNRATSAGVRQVQVGCSFRQQLSGDKVRCPTREACQALTRLGSQWQGEQGALLKQLLTHMTRKSMLIDRIRRDLRFRALMRVWLVLHVPLSFALLAAVIAHIISVFYYW
jgi:cytochrome b561